MSSPMTSGPDGSAANWRSRLARRGGSLAREYLAPFAGLLLIVLFFWGAEYAQARLRGDRYRGSFLSARNVRLTIIDTGIVSMCALGMTVIIISGGIDLSVGTAMALCAMTLAILLKQEVPAPVAIAACVGVGCLTGLLNGALVSLLRVAPFIVTLGTMTVYLGLAKSISLTTVDSPQTTPAWLSSLLSGDVNKAALFLLPTGVWLMWGLALLLSLVLRQTVFSRHVFALGSNEATARLCGVNVTGVKLAVYTLGGFFVGMAGVLMFAKLQQGNPTSGSGWELKVIAAVVIGGASLSGGRGSVLGTLIGAANMAALQSGLDILNWGAAVQDLIIGSIIIVVVTIDQYRQRLTDSG